MPKFKGHYHEVKMEFLKPKLESQAARMPDVLSSEADTPQSLHITRQVGFLVPDRCTHPDNGITISPNLLIAYHGSTEDAKIFRHRTTAECYDRLACEEGYVVAYPDGYKGNWNDSRITAKYATKTENIDDIEFTLAIIEYASTHFKTSSNRPFVVGQGNGGQFVFRLCLQLGSAVIAGGAVHTMTLAAPENIDPIVPINGGEVALALTHKKKAIGSRGKHLGSNETASFFSERFSKANFTPKKRNYCIQSKDKAAAEVTEWLEDGKTRVIVKLIKLIGEGHTIPTGQGQLRNSLLGPRRGALNAPEQVIEFFKQSV
ncbi:hypothetical protein BY996DRAFT_6419290 [Phakopsora pachyrhizi]|nr:hypothetical protein BY996DRAFT_6419290 [Phakopsora pachyrhizi]